MDEHRTLERVSNRALENCYNIPWHQGWDVPWLGATAGDGGVFVAEAEKVLRNYVQKQGPRIIVDPTLGRNDDEDSAPAYHPRGDVVRTMPKGQFRSVAHYYHVMLHELTHSTGHTFRLNRPEVMRRPFVGPVRKALEELTAESGAVLMSACHGTANEEVLENSAKYMASFLCGVTRSDQPHILKLAAQQASKAAEYIRTHST